MIRCSEEADRYATGEGDWLCGTVRTDLGTETRGVIFCHGAGDTHIAPHRPQDQGKLLHALARRATVHTADLGGDTWGNDTGMARVADSLDLLRNLGVEGPVALVGMSMGVGVALNYALRNPEDVACVAGVIPLTDIASTLWFASASVNAAYPPAYDDDVHGPDRSPVQFAADLDADLPIHLWAASDDIYTPYATAQAFVAARPQTELTNVGALGHTDAATTAATAGIVSFVREHLGAP